MNLIFRNHSTNFMNSHTLMNVVPLPGVKFTLTLVSGFYDPLNRPPKNRPTLAGRFYKRSQLPVIRWRGSPMNILDIHLGKLNIGFHHLQGRMAEECLQREYISAVPQV